jgi:rubrerythrin
MTPVRPQILTALTAGIQSEIASYVFYISAARKSQAAKFKDVLEKLALEEKSHFQILEGEHDSLVRSEKWISTADILKQPGLPQITEEMSERHRELIAQVERAATVDAILDIAFRLEEEAFELFDREAKRADSREGRQVFEDLAKFEQGHMAIIEQMMKEYGS